MSYPEPGYGRFLHPLFVIVACLAVVVVLACSKSSSPQPPAAAAPHESIQLATVESLPAKREAATLTYAPEVPPPITRHEPAIVEVHLEASRLVAEIYPQAKYELWTFNKHVPGPFIRVRRGDVLELHMENVDKTGTPHNVDLHAVTGLG